MKCNTAQCSCIRSHISCSNHCHPRSKCENNKIDQKQKCEQQKIFSDKDIKVLECGWLTDQTCWWLTIFWKKHYPSVDRLQDTLLQQNFSWDIPSSELVQVLHVNSNHWITVSNIGLSDSSVTCVWFIVQWDQSSNKRTYCKKALSLIFAWRSILEFPKVLVE